MDIARKVGTLITMVIPSFVGAGAIWQIFANWLAVIVWLVIMAVLAGAILSRRRVNSFQGG